jgi:hypothetical protein
MGPKVLALGVRSWCGVMPNGFSEVQAPPAVSGILLRRPAAISREWLHVCGGRMSDDGDG